MNHQYRISFFLVCLFTGILTACNSQNPINWTPKQLMEPANLAASIKSKKDVPVIISVGPGASIPGTVNIGPVNTKEGLDKLKNFLKTKSKQTKIVVYCGCCPFEHCPNARPAVKTLQDLSFTQFYLLNLPNNIKRDWIDKGYPTN